MAQTQQNFKIQLNFNHPCRYLIWAATTPVHGAFSASQKSLEANDNYAPFASSKLQINGIDRFTERPGSYFRFVQPFTTFGKSPSAGIYSYSFGLSGLGQNSGTMNFSRIDFSTLLLTTKAASAATIASIQNENETTSMSLTAYTGLKVFAVNFNVLRVMSGMGGMAYAN
jgi:hypothetical protein